MQFIHFSKSQSVRLESSTSSFKALDIGCAYGVACLPLINETKNIDVIAMDLCEEHLEYLLSQVDDKEESKARVSTIQGMFPQEFNIKHFEQEPLDAIHCSQMFHFLNGDDTLEGLAKIYDSLKSGGRLFISTVSVHFCSFKKYLPTYMSRKESGEKWPGYVENILDYVHADSVPFMSNSGGFHLFTLDDFVDAIKQAGFTIISSSTFDISDHPEHNSEQQGVIGVIAKK